MARRKVNFNPGPAALPLKVLERVRDELLDYRGTGMSILETSHRSGEFAEILKGTKALFRDILGIPDDYEILFLGGGASLQFAMIPMNFLPRDGCADYVVTGTWAKKAHKEAEIMGKANVAGTTESMKFTRLPKPGEMTFDPGAAYVHMTSNNTIFGTQWKRFPDTGDVPLFCDMSSDILSRTVDVNRYALIYAGAQKNLGPAGTTVVILKRDLIDKGAAGVPTMLSYKTHVEKDSLFNTPPVFAIYAVKLVLEWVQESGGLNVVQTWNEEKGRILYGAIEESDGFYRGTVVEEGDRSLMNATLRLPSEELEKAFIDAAASANFHGLKGHRSVGGVRVSMYNAISVSDISELAEFMRDFKKSH